MLPNYTPEGVVLFGSVPWDNGYKHVRLYNNRSEQYEDIASQMYITSDTYTYIGRERRLKVAIEADRLYSCNYCMYQNSSVSDTYIYCFITSVNYINDNTTEIVLETDIFQTYLYDRDWDIRSCFIARETPPSESSKYLYTPEADFPLIYKVDAEKHMFFRTGSIGIFSASDVDFGTLEYLFQPWNPEGAVAVATEPVTSRGVAQGAPLTIYALDAVGAGSEKAQEFVKRMNQAGSTDSIVGIISIPSFYKFDGTVSKETNTPQDSNRDITATFDAPEWGTTVDGYTPRNAKLLYYPYTYCNLTDYNGSNTELRYEFMDSLTIGIKYRPTLTCQAYVFPTQYMGRLGFDDGFPVMCGTRGSITSNTFTNWLAQNGATIALTVAGVAVGLVTGGTSLAAAAANTSEATALRGAGMSAFAGVAERDAALKATAGQALIGSSVMGAAQTAANVYNASKQPNQARGQTSADLAYSVGLQGVHAQKICVKAEIAQQIDAYFDKKGYAIERIEPVNITSRPSWNYVQTVDCAPRSLNGASGDEAPFTRGRGTPAAALDVIRRCFDSGITFWHTTTGFGDYSQDNSL